MKKLFVFAVALGFFACVPAPAQNNDRHGNRHDDGGSNAAHGSADTHRGGQEPVMKGATMQQNTSGGRAAMAARSPATRRNTPAVETTQNRFLPSSGDTHPAAVGHAAADTRRNSNWSGGARPSQAERSATDRSRSNWSGGATAHSSNHDALRRNAQASRRFHRGNYIAPQGYQSRHWTYGERLPRLYYASNYWIGDFMMFGLFAPPSDLVWVRVGDDALLVDRYSGEIVQVEYGFFY
jgi:Ni/Co efflux regulator RcnB